MPLVTQQTGPAGRMVRQRARRGGLRDRARALPRRDARPRAAACVTVIASHRGRHGDRGGRREDAGEDPARADRPGGRPAAPSRRASSPSALGLPTASSRQARRRSSPRCTRRSSRRDASLVEINPLVRHRGRATLIALDAKINFDDNALFRHPDVRGAARPDEEDPRERRGREGRPQLHRARRQHRLHGQRRRPRDGDHGHHQATRAASRPTSSTSAAAPTPRRSRRRSASSSPTRTSRRVFVNIFGGIMRCDVIAEGVVAAAQRGRARRCRSSCAWKAPTSSRASRSSPSPGSTSITAADMADGRAEGRAPPAREAASETR